MNNSYIRSFGIQATVDYAPHIPIYFNAPIEVTESTSEYKFAVRNSLDHIIQKTRVIFFSSLKFYNQSLIITL